MLRWDSHLNARGGLVIGVNDSGDSGVCANVQLL